MGRQRGSEGGQLTGMAVMKGPGASQPSPGPLPLQPGTLQGLVEAACQAGGVDGCGGGEADKARDLADRCTQNTSTATSLAAEGGC